MDFHGKVALVTGGASGIGKEIVKALVDNGLKHISVLDIDKKNGKIMKDELEAKHKDCIVLFITADVTKDVEFEDAFQETVSKFNKIDIVVNNVGILNEENYKSTIDINLNVAILDINIANGKAVIDEFNTKYGKGKAVLIITDVTNSTNFKDAFELTISTFGRIDIVVNNAGLTNEIDYEYMINVNLTGVVRGTKLGFKHMSKTNNGNGGVILNIASFVGLSNCYPMPVYAATKGAVISFVKSYGHPYHCEEKGINIMALCPGITTGTSFGNNVLTSLTDEDREEAMKFITTLKSQTPDCVGRAAIYLIKNGTTGSAWVVEGGDLFTTNMPARSTYQTLLKQNI